MNTAIGFFAGVLLGFVFYGGLWLTVRHLTVTSHPAALTLYSLLVRTAVVCGGILSVARGRWQNVLACLAGLAASRLLVSRFWALCT